MQTCRSLREGPFDGTIGVRTWEAQARDITSGITSSDKYKSIALHAEVRRGRRMCIPAEGWLLMVRAWDLGAWDF